MKKSAALLLVLVFLIATCMVASLPVNAEPQTIVVPDDYATIQAAINAANEGDAIFVKKGTYEEQTLKINKTLSLIGEDVNNTIISLHPPWVPTGGYHIAGTGLEPDYAYDNAIKITANNVRISGFKIISNASGKPRIYGVGTQITANYITTGLVLDNFGQNITGNIVKGGITCTGSNHTIANNILDGVWVLASGVLIKNNTISDDAASNSVGIQIGANGNTIFNNTIKNCRIGIAFWAYAADNTIYGNNFVNNTVHVQIGDTYKPSMGKWDNGYALGGNYWSDYLAKYPNASEIGNSGIGDTSYVIDANNIDHYPLISPYENLPREPQLEPSSALLVVAVVIAAAAVVGAGLLVYFKKRKH